MIIQHFLIGYDKVDDRIKVEFPIRREQLEAVKRQIKLYSDDPDALDPYPLEPPVAKRIGDIIDRKINGDAYAFYLQAYDVADEIDRAKDRMAAR